MKGSELEDRRGFLPRFQPYPLGDGGQHQGSPGNHFAAGSSFHHQQHHAGNGDTPPSIDEAEVDSRAMVLASPPQQPAMAPVPDTPNKQKKSAAANMVVASGEGGGDGATIEVVRRPRGRPPGSKNKPKPPVVITRESGDSNNVMRPHILEIPAGHDVVDALTHFSRRRDLGLSVLAATGPVSNVTIRQPQFHSSGAAISGSPPSSASTTLTFHGRFDILSVSATFFPPSFSSASSVPPSAPAGGSTFSISLAGPHGQIVGGCVAGPLVAAGTVTVVAAAFSGPTFYRLPADEELAVSVSVSPAPPSGGDATSRAQPIASAEPTHHRPSPHPRQHQHLHHQQQQQQQQQQHHLAPHHHHHAGAGSMPGEQQAASPMPISSSHLLSDVIWAPTARPPHHHHSPYQ